MNYKKLILTTVFIMMSRLSSFASCLPAHEDAFIVNEINTHGNWIELYANPTNIQSPIFDWTATVCTTDQCESITFSFDISTNPDGFFYVIDFDALFGGNDWNGKSLDVRIQDDAGNEVNYFNLGLKKGNNDSTLSVPTDVVTCGIYDVSCDYYLRTNSSESNFNRDPDGGCGVTETTPWNDNTEGGSNNPEPLLPINLSISDVSIQEGDSGATQFSFNISVDGNFTYILPIYIAYSTADDSATVADNDYTPIINGLVALPAGESSVQVTVDVIGDLNVEIDETFFLNLHTVTVGTLIDNQGIGTIVNDDGGAGVPNPGTYNAIDFNGICNAQTNWNDNLETKIVNDNINLSILALEQGTVPPIPMEANITKVSLVHYPSGNNNACTGTALSSVDVCTNCGLTDVDGCLSLSIDKSFNQRASRCVEIVIQGKDKDDTTGISLSDSNSSDNLAIRPNTYNCDGVSSGVLISEHTYPSTFDATPLNLTTPALGYTTSFVNITAKKYTRLGDLNSSLSGVFSPSILNFVDGNSSANLYFNDVADVGIDLNDSVWADVDSDDTAEVNRVIHAECRRLFIPDHFEVALNKPLLENNSTFTYLSNDLNMSAWVRNLDVTITAQGEANGVMQNYTYPINTYYANQVTLSPNLSLPSHGATSALLGSELNDENSTDIIGFEFINGVASYSYEDMRFNYPRDYSSPISPFQIDGNLTDFSLVVQDNLYPSVDGNDSTDADGNATFYYGRLHPSDLVASAVPQTNTIPFEVYDETGSSFISGMTQTGLSWYINSLHVDNTMGDIIEANASSSTIMGSLVGFGFTYLPVSVGEQDLNIATVGSEEKTVIHLKTQEWLWYVPSGFGTAYDDSTGSDCTMHPCFKLSIISVNTPSFIQSGSFEGAEVPDVNRSDYFKKGIKLFR